MDGGRDHRSGLSSALCEGKFPQERRYVSLDGDHFLGSLEPRLETVDLGPQALVLGDKRIGRMRAARSGQCSRLRRRRAAFATRRCCCCTGPRGA